MGSSAGSLLRVASATPPRPRDCSHSCSVCPARGRARGGRSYTEEDSTEVGATAHREGGAAGIVQEDGGVLPRLREGRSQPGCRRPEGAPTTHRAHPAPPGDPAPLTPGLVPPPQLHQPPAPTGSLWCVCRGASLCSGPERGSSVKQFPLLHSKPESVLNTRVRVPLPARAWPLTRMVEPRWDWYSGLATPNVVQASAGSHPQM